MSRSSTDTMVKWIGMAAGLAVAATLLLGWRAPGATPTLGADVTLVATPPGELVVSQSGSFLRGRGLVQGGPAAAGRLGLRNITGRTLEVQVRLLPSTSDLDGALRVELEDAGTPVAVGTLGTLRRWSRPALRIDPGERRQLDARALIRPRAVNYEGRIVDVALELRARPVER